MHCRDFLVVEKNGEFRILPGHVDYQRDDVLAELNGYTIIKRCATQKDALRALTESRFRDIDQVRLHGAIVPHC
jgi:hypothetical protein